MTITEREYSTPIIGNKSLAFKKQQPQRQTHFNFETVPFWFSHEDPTHVKEIIKTYSELLRLNHERPKNSRAPPQFIGRIARRPELFDKDQHLFETLDLISVYELKCVCEGRTMPLVVQHKLRTRWNTDEGLPSSTIVLTSCKPGAEAVRMQQGQSLNNNNNSCCCNNETTKNTLMQPPVISIIASTLSPTQTSNMNNANFATVLSPSSPLFNLKPLSASMNRSSTLLNLQVEEELNNSSGDESSPAIPRDASSIDRSYMKPSYLYCLPEIGYTEVVGSAQVYKYFVASNRLRVGYADLQSQAQAHFYLDSHIKITKAEPKDCKYLKNEEDIEYVDDDATDLLSFNEDPLYSYKTMQQFDHHDDQDNELEYDEEDEDDTADTFLLQVASAPFDDDNCGTSDAPHLQLLLQCDFGTQGVILNAGLHFEDDENDEDYEDDEQEEQDDNDDDDDDDEDEYEDDEDEEEDSDDDLNTNSKRVPQQQVQTCSPLRNGTASPIPNRTSGKIYCK